MIFQEKNSDIFAISPTPSHPPQVHDCALVTPFCPCPSGGLCTALISGIFIIIKYIYNPFLIDALVAYGMYFLPHSVTRSYRGGPNPYKHPTHPHPRLCPSGGLCTPLMLYNCVVDQNHNLKINVPHSLMNEEVSEMYI